MNNGIFLVIGIWFLIKSNKKKSAVSNKINNDLIFEDEVEAQSFTKKPIETLNSEKFERQNDKVIIKDQTNKPFEPIIVQSFIRADLNNKPFKSKRSKTAKFTQPFEKDAINLLRTNR